MAIETITVQNYPYLELMIKRYNNSIEVVHIDYKKDGTVKEHTSILLSDFAVKELIKFALKNK